jgi:hypothetical protein
MVAPSALPATAKAAPRASGRPKPSTGGDAQGKSADHGSVEREACDRTPERQAERQFELLAVAAPAIDHGQQQKKTENRRRQHRQDQDRREAPGKESAARHRIGQRKEDHPPVDLARHQFLDPEEVQQDERKANSRKADVERDRLRLPWREEPRQIGDADQSARQGRRPPGSFFPASRSADPEKQTRA